MQSPAAQRQVGWLFMAGIAQRSFTTEVGRNVVQPQQGASRGSARLASPGHQGDQTRTHQG